MKLINSAILAIAGKTFAEISSGDATSQAGQLASSEGVISSEADPQAIFDFFASSCDGAEACLNAVEILAQAQAEEEEQKEKIKKCQEEPPTDPSEQMLCARSMTTSAPSSALTSARKLKQLKVLILWLQPEHRFARYCFYGCWCLPDNDHKLFTVGYGKPVDNVDASCKRQSQCYDCAQIDHGDRVCDANTQSYKFKLHYDPADPNNHMKKSIECLDEPSNKPGSKGSCKRSICECDKKLSEDLREHFSEWYEGHHQEQGTFDSATQCVIEGCHNGNCGGNEIQCCGNLGSGIRMPYKTDGRRKCCGDKTYDSTFQECCEGNQLAAIGTC